MKKILAFVCLCSLLAPAPWGIALNHQTQECAGFWGGDEYGSFDLPVDWEAYYPDSDGMIQTEIGSCTLSSTRPYEGAEACCEELGYTYVSPNIGEARTSPLIVILVVVLVLVVVVVVLVVGLVVVGGFLLWKRRRNKRLRSGEGSD